MPTKEFENTPFDNDKNEKLKTEDISSESISAEQKNSIAEEASNDAICEAFSDEADVIGDAYEESDNTPSESTVTLGEESDDTALDESSNPAISSSDSQQAENTDVSSDTDFHAQEQAAPALNYDIFGNLGSEKETEKMPIEAAAETVFVAEPPEVSEHSSDDEAQETFEAVFPEAFPSVEQSDEESQCSEAEDYTDEASSNEEQTRHPIHGLFDFLELFVFSFVAVLIFTTFFFRHSVVEGDSMIDTLHEGEHLIISDLFYTPEKGDIIVCEDYSTSLRKPIVKRIIATEGDYVQVLITGEVFINGKLIEEDYVYIDGPLPITPVDTVVPEGEVFVMGDHRNMSTDSRMFGTIDEDSIIGKVLLRFYPFDTFGRVE